jgi:hypothetical protein
MRNINGCGAVLHWTYAIRLYTMTCNIINFHIFYSQLALRWIRVKRYTGNAVAVNAHIYVGQKNYQWIWIAVDRFGKILCVQ